MEALPHAWDFFFFVFFWLLYKLSRRGTDNSHLGWPGQSR
jgi:hypothetical protein